MAFISMQPGTGVEHSVIVPVIIANSTTINQGEVVQINSSGFLTNGSGIAAGPVFGICVGFAASDGTPIPPTAYAAGTATGTDVTQVASASNNQTVAQQMGLVEISTQKRWSAQVNGTVGTTAASGKIGVYIDTDSADSNYDRLLETTATRTVGTVTNFFGWGTDPNDSTRIIVSIRTSQLFSKQS